MPSPSVLLEPTILSPLCRKKMAKPPPPDFIVGRVGNGEFCSTISLNAATPSCLCVSGVSRSRPHTLDGPKTTLQLHAGYSRDHLSMVSRSHVAAAVGPAKHAARL